MATSKVIVEMEIELAHAEGMSSTNVHMLAKSAIDQAFGYIEGKYIGNNTGEVLVKKIKKISDKPLGRTKTTVFR